MAGRKQQYRANIFSFVVALIIVIFMVNRYFDQGLFAPVSATFAATIDAGTNTEIAKWLFIWAIPGAIIQFIGGERQIGILFATGLLVGTTMNGVTILDRSSHPPLPAEAERGARADAEHPGRRRSGWSGSVQLLHRYAGIV